MDREISMSGALSLPFRSHDGGAEVSSARVSSRASAEGLVYNCGKSRTADACQCLNHTHMKCTLPSNIDMAKCAALAKLTRGGGQAHGSTHEYLEIQGA